MFNAKNDLLPMRSALFLCPFYAENRAHDSPASVASVSVRFRSKKRGSRVKADAKSSPSRFISRAVKPENPVPSFFALKPSGKRLLRRLAIANQIGGFFYGYDLECLWRLQKRKSYKKRTPSGPASTAGEAIEKMLVEKRISLKINYEVLRDLETSQSSKPALPDKPAAEPVIPAKREFLTPRVPTRTGGRKRLV